MTAGRHLNRCCGIRVITNKWLTNQTEHLNIGEYGASALAELIEANHDFVLYYILHLMGGYF